MQKAVFSISSVPVHQENNSQNNVQRVVTCTGDTRLQMETSEVANYTQYFPFTPVIQPTLESMCNGQEAFVFFMKYRTATHHQEKIRIHLS